MIVQDIDLKNLIPKYATQEENPNRMSDERYRALVAIIAEVGFSQPIIVRKAKGGKFEIIDGHHRRLVALELGIASIPSVIIDATDTIASALSVGLNHIRGDTNLSVAADLMRVLSDSIEAEMIAVLTGFSLSEVEALVSTPTAATDLADMVSVSEPMDEREEKPHVLEVRFTSVELYRTVRRKLKKAAGKGGDLAKGLLTVLGIDEEDLS